MVQQWYCLTYSWVYIFSSKMEVIAQLGFEPTYCDAAVQHVSRNWDLHFQYFWLQSFNACVLLCANALRKGTNLSLLRLFVFTNLSPCDTRSTFLSEFNRFQFRVFLLLDGFPHRAWKNSLPYYLLINGVRIIGFIPFPTVLVIGENAVSLVQDLNSCRCVHFLWRKPLHNEQTEISSFYILRNYIDCTFSFWYFVHLFLNRFFSRFYNINYSKYKYFAHCSRVSSIPI